MFSLRDIRTPKFCLLLVAIFLAAPFANASNAGWISWRGPKQVGSSPEKGLIDSWEVDGKNQLWTLDLAGRGTPLTYKNRVIVWGYEGEGENLREVIMSLDIETGKEIWKRHYSDFISDNIYTRYSIGAPAIDEETGNIYLTTTPGLFVCINQDGKELWQISLMEQYGRLTFPNGRTGGPVIDGDLVVVRGIMTNWGSQGPARDRFYGFDKNSGQLVWASTPGVAPKDSSFSSPIFETRNGKRVFYAGTGCGNIVCVNALNGDPLWRFQFSHGGVNSSVLVHEDRLIAIHGKENLDSSEIGRMAAIKLGTEPKPGEKGPVVLSKDSELWRAPLKMFTSSPTLGDDGLIYQVTHEGELACVDPNDGTLLWKEKLGLDQLHASPLYADGKLYIPVKEGLFYIIKPSRDKMEVLSKVKVEGLCIGSPSVWGGRIFLHTTKKLYCIGKPQAPALETEKPETIATGKVVRLQLIPNEVLMLPGEKQSFKIRSIDANGRTVAEVEGAEWAKFIPPTAKVKVKMDANFINGTTLSAGKDAKISAGAYKATAGGLSGTIRGRVLPPLPYEQDFESFDISVPHKTEEGVKFAYPPLPWIGARLKWEVRERDGSKVLAKTLDRVLFQRSTVFIGRAEMKNYTMQADVMTDGGRRNKGDVGVVNQRYIIALKGNQRLLEVSSNHERVKVSVPFVMSPKKWYTLKTEVEAKNDGSGVVRGKVWLRDQQEPQAWTIEVPLQNVHANGSPGLYGLGPQSQLRVYLDNIKVTPNK